MGTLLNIAGATLSLGSPVHPVDDLIIYGTVVPKISIVSPLRAS